MRLPYDQERYNLEIFPIIPLSGMAEDSSPIEDFKKHWKLYEQNAQAALAWIRSKKADPKKIKILWFGKEDGWWPAGKTIRL
mgnify:FL=1